MTLGGVILFFFGIIGNKVSFKIGIQNIFSAIAMTESEDSFVLQAACAISFDSIDSLCNIAQSQQSLESLTSLDSIPPRCYSLR